MRIGDVDKCDCGETIFWVKHRTSRAAPYSENGLIHFATCQGKFKREPLAGRPVFGQPPGA